MSKWFWIISLQRAVSTGMQFTTLASEYDLPDGFSRQAAFLEIQQVALKQLGWQGFPTVLFFSLEPAQLPAPRTEPITAGSQS